MPAINHSEYQNELERINYTLGYIDKNLEDLEEKRVIESNKLLGMKKRYNSDNSQNYIDMMIQTMLNDRIDLKIRNLHVAKLKPYFARIDFIEDGKEEKEKLYIGKMSLMREEDNTIIIVDWRAPIANLYYDGRIGNENYDCPDGKISGQLVLKRQYVIDNRILHEIMDIEITTNDELLQQSLGSNADNRLKDIVSTIQAEQNKIIRSNMFVPLIIQGAAGSGKTTIALHRIAYLIYAYEESFIPENFMIIAPNKLFINYISEVLPELGVDRVHQTTFEELAMHIIEKKIKIIDYNQKLIDIIEKNDGKLKEISTLKSSLKYKDMIETYIKVFEKLILPRENFKLFDYTIIKLDEINNLYYKELVYLPVNKRIENIIKYISKRLKDKKEWIIENLQDECDKKVLQLKYLPESPQRQKMIIEVLDEKDEKIHKINTYSKNAICKYIKKISKNPIQIYNEFIKDEKLFNIISKKIFTIDEFKYLREHTEKVINSGTYEIEDLAPIMYIAYMIFGIPEDLTIKHAVIDEAQDYSIFQFYVLKKILKESSFTILGDLCQGIHSFRGTTDWSHVIENIYIEEKCEFLTLAKSYRTTVEIMNCANKVIELLKDDKLFLAQPVLRHGDNPIIVKKDCLTDVSKDIVKKIKEYRESGYKSIAIILKKQDECERVFKEIKDKIDGIELISGKIDKYNGGVVIIPSYLSKGLEFDIVIIGNANSENFQNNELDAKLLYVSMTRPLHKLLIYYVGEKTIFIDNK